mmetsp:Transcript_19044/g.28786  ORF Transcript_19044/g.28786 Transcript_19044/m.28786 type:complete len:112 (+) Transcript_19044:50-385(+)
MADAWKTEVEAISTEILTAEAPGKWAGKEGKHIPTVTVADGKVTVSVPHGMADDHWINYIWCKTDDKIIAITKLTPTDKPELVFDKPEVKEIVAYESCNLHGVWATAPISL